MLDIFKKLQFTQVEKMNIEYIIVGLGNPGREYESTRHNAGFMAIDYIAEKCGVKISKLKYKALYAEALICDKRVLLLKPQTFMNNSGQSVKEVMDFYKIPSKNVIIIFDDISLEPGKLRIRRKGSHGGHNGLKDIIYLSGTDDFPRVKIGVGAKPHPSWNLADWVLSSFKQDEKEKINLAIENVYNAVELIVAQKYEEAMNKYNS